mmetsp:Transcript_36844/g.57618  ORF Transcript_36844/g.57618 Transcript_36844/m.57618 type:complete len:514 (+) Transcript_36844:353-1894(+)
MMPVAPNGVDDSGKTEALVETVSNVPPHVSLDQVLSGGWSSNKVDDLSKRNGAGGMDPSKFSSYEYSSSVAEKQQKAVVALLLLNFVALTVVYTVGTEYDDSILNSVSRTDPTTYLLYNHVVTMIFLGFGFLMAFLYRYSYSSIGYTFIISVLALFWCTFLVNYFHHCREKCETVKLEVASFFPGLFGAGAIMITFGGVLGKVTILHLVIIAMIEAPLFALNDMLCFGELSLQDAGGTITIHTFGAYFGVFLCFMRRHAKGGGSGDNTSNPEHDCFAMIGTLFLWMLWPSFNAAVAGHGESLAIVNTILAISASCFSAFLVSALEHKGKFNMVHVQNATLAGGVAIGAMADQVDKAAVAMIIGFIAGAVSTIGYNYITPFLEAKLGLHDTCGIHNLHGMPGIIGAVVSFAVVEDVDGQVGKQVKSLFITLGIALGGAVVTGLILNMIPGNVEDDMFKDDLHWLHPENEGQWRKARSSILHKFRGDLGKGDFQIAAQQVLSPFHVVTPRSHLVS